MIVIPAIDIYENKVVRLKEGDFNRVSYYSRTPEEQAKIFEDHSFKYLHIVDLSGSKTGIISVLDTIRKIKSATNMSIEFGGGIRNAGDVEEILSSGVDKVIIGSMAVTNKGEFEKVIKSHGASKIIAAADVQNQMIAVKGWTEQTSLSVFDHIEYCLNLGIDTFLCTDISKDGLLTGTNVALYKNILTRFPGINLIASGGIKDLEDVINVKDINAYGVVVGRAIYEGKIDLKELSEIGK